VPLVARDELSARSVLQRLLLLLVALLLLLLPLGAHGRAPYC
jgi:hypothetical protein